MSKLVLVRHGESTWNEEGLWTGYVDVDLDEEGILQAKEDAKAIVDMSLDIAFVSSLRRAQHTLEIILATLNKQNIPIYISSALNERDYGDLTGENKWEIEKKFGEAQFFKWRRGWDDLVPGGESLKDVFSRVAPYYDNDILPVLKDEKNCIISAHGNSLRALVKHIESLSETEVEKLNIETGEVYVYTINADGKVVNKEIRGNKTK